MLFFMGKEMTQHIVLVNCDTSIKGRWRKYLVVGGPEPVFIGNGVGIVSFETGSKVVEELEPRVFVSYDAGRGMLNLNQEASTGEHNIRKSRLGLN